jgi:hypothetical protein
VRSRDELSGVRCHWSSGFPDNRSDSPSLVNARTRF